MILGRTKFLKYYKYFLILTKYLLFIIKQDAYYLLRN